MSQLPNFLVDYKAVHQRISEINPTEYARTRNYVDGSVTYLSPFITHGVISTLTVAKGVLARYTGTEAEKLLTELAWREYFHRTWQVNGSGIFSDLSHAQENCISNLMPAAVANSCTGLDAIDNALKTLERHGYMHNHARLWVAALCCNIGHTHWHQPARWLYYHLLDGDLASNSLSWQWVAGTFSHRKYIANQENLNRYSRLEQNNTYIDVDYEELSGLATPPVLKSRVDLHLSNEFPPSTVAPVFNSDKAVFLYSIWNLDPEWRQDQQGLRILWIDPEMHNEFALSPLRWQFIWHWADAIDGLGIFVGNQTELFPSGTEQLMLYTREYPATMHWPGHRDEREWCFDSPDAPFRSFSNYWKKVRKSAEFFA